VQILRNLLFSPKLHNVFIIQPFFHANLRKPPFKLDYCHGPTQFLVQRVNLLFS